MVIRLKTAAELSATAPERWRSQYATWSDTDRFADGKTKKQVNDAINSSTATPQHIAAATNKGWAYPECALCNRYVLTAISFCPDYSDYETIICADCIGQASTIINQVDHGRAE